MLFVLTPQASSQAYFNPEQLYADYRRREYVAALQEEHQRAQFEHELALEEQRHRQALAAIAQQEAARRQRQASVHFAARRAQQQENACGGGMRCGRPAPEEILRRRQARQQEEERISREFHKHVLSQLFGVATDESAPQEPAAAPVASVSHLLHSIIDMHLLTPLPQTSAKGKESTVKRPGNEEAEPHWSAAPERAKALAEITSINRTFTSLKNTFVFPTGPLERIPDSDVPRLAFNPTNASIHAYEHALAELLTKLDAVESHGFKGVREARKRLVVSIEKVLEDLEKQVAERLTENASPAAVPAEIPASPTVAHAEEKDVVMEDAQPAAKQASTSTEGYDVEFDAAPEPVAEQATEVTMTDESAPVAEAISEEAPVVSVEPVVEPSTESTEKVATPQPEESHEPTAVTSAVLPASTSDEESEIEDAVHIEISSDEEDIVDAREGEAHSDTEGAFEML